ncbi:hypothetical protein AWB69_05079 [Caballeronia udeis]|uniref:DUF2867 domain-containing protein n=1 Tax=Caballeronia udeis TaxID=1232866 RepID=A0A158I285_9BURK|nr:DUF2867 domain-containing protein [Caballeronia udeis]SAL50221.1 hypothetical protein AWB69_05079 [Caballeronia udeis]
MQNPAVSVTAVALPASSHVTQMYAHPNLADAYTIRLPDNATTDPELLSRFMFSHQAAWIGKLLRVRDSLVAGFGLKTSKRLEESARFERDKHVSFFRIYERTADEIVLGEDDKHLDFRLSVFQGAREEAAGGGRYLTVSTVVRCHNLLGRTYILLITPFHEMVVRSSLRRAARIGWPTAS